MTAYVVRRKERIAANPGWERWEGVHRLRQPPAGVGLNNGRDWYKAVPSTSLSQSFPGTTMRVWLKRIGYVVGALVALVLIVVSVVYGMSESRFRRTYTVAPEQHAFSTDSA